MQKVDRLDWAAGMSIRSYGLRIGFRSNDPALLERIPEHLPAGWKADTSLAVDRLYSLIGGGPDPRPGVRRFNLLYANWSRVARTRELSEIFPALENDIQQYIAEDAKDRVFVHAGVVAWGKRAIVIPGRTHSGKTSLVAALVRAGATYYSDEFAVLDARGRVHPFPRPLSIRGDANAVGQRVQVEALGGRAGDKPLPVGMVLVTEYRAGVRWRPRAISPGQAAMDLMFNTVAVRKQPELTLATLERCVSGAPILLKGGRGEADEIAKRIIQKMEEPLS